MAKHTPRPRPSATPKAKATAKRRLGQKLKFAKSTQARADRARIRRIEKGNERNI